MTGVYKPIQVYPVVLRSKKGVFSYLDLKNGQLQVFKGVYSSKQVYTAFY